MNTIHEMESKGWIWATTIEKTSNRWEWILKQIAPWLTVCTTQSDYDKKACDIWKRDEIPDGLQINWK